jgi:hypothetical protein
MIMIINIEELEECCPVQCSVSAYAQSGEGYGIYVNWMFEVNGKPMEYSLVGKDMGKMCDKARLGLLEIINVGMIE